MKVLRRYTSLPILLDLLAERRLVFVNPSTWDDKNDSYYLELYRKKRRLKSLLAVCLSQARETYHHWGIFAPGPSGVSIVFDREGLLDALRQDRSVTIRSVEYKSFKDAKATPFLLDDLPFLKRDPFEPEGELRAIACFRTLEKDFHGVPIPLECVKKIYVSPWLAKSLVRHVRHAIHAIDGCDRLEVVSSNLISSETWKGYGDSAVPAHTPRASR